MRLEEIRQMIAALKQERTRIDAVIYELETLGFTPPSRRRERRGRKSMNAEERQQVGERMRKYWADRRKS